MSQVGTDSWTPGSWQIFLKTSKELFFFKSSGRDASLQGPTFTVTRKGQKGQCLQSLLNIFCTSRYWKSIVFGTVTALPLRHTILLLITLPQQAHTQVRDTIQINPPLQIQQPTCLLINRKVTVPKQICESQQCSNTTREINTYSSLLFKNKKRL